LPQEAAKCIKPLLLNFKKLKLFGAFEKNVGGTEGEFRCICSKEYAILTLWGKVP
jgi:hypothetical protein